MNKNFAMTDQELQLFSFGIIFRKSNDRTFEKQQQQQKTILGHFPPK